MRWLALALGVFGTTPSVAAQSSVLAGIDVYRSRDVFTSTLHEHHGQLLDSITTAVAASDMNAVERTISALGTRLKGSGRFAFLDFSPIQYFKGDTTVWYLTVDIVDSLDIERLSFASEPSGHVEGVDDALSAWRDFASVGQSTRAFWQPGSPCRVHHCLFDFDAPALTGYEARLLDLAETHSSALERTIAVDQDPERRAAAVFLLAHLDDESRVARAMKGRLNDPSSLVRNNAMRVIAFMVRERASKEFSVEPFLKLVDGPTTTDRNKALAIVDGLVDDPSHHDIVKRRAGPALLGLLALQQPNNHDFAFSILKKMSGLALDERDYEGWGKWLLTSISIPR